MNNIADLSSPSILGFPISAWFIVFCVSVIGFIVCTILVIASFVKKDDTDSISFNKRALKADELSLDSINIPSMNLSSDNVYRTEGMRNNSFMTGEAKTYNMSPQYGNTYNNAPYQGSYNPPPVRDNTYKMPPRNNPPGINADMTSTTAMDAFSGNSAPQSSAADAPIVRFCTKCGNKVSSNFCSNCGNKIE